MSNLPIKSALDDSGAFYPESHERAITDDNGTTLETKLQMVKTPVLTLNSAPTSSTLTHTEGGVTYTFKVGDEVRVRDTEKGTAEGNYYVFYTLKDKSNGTAYWEESGSGGGGVATNTYSVLIDSNQVDKSDIANAKVTYNSIEYSNGDTIFVPISTEITVSDLSASSVTGYSVDVQVSGWNIIVTYSTEILTVTITADETPANVSLCTIVVTDSNSTTLGTLSSGQSLKIPYGTTYTCTPSASPDNDYKKPANITKDWSDTTAKSLTFTYECMYVDFGLPSGVKWAKCDIGASSPEEQGLFFSWGNTDGHTVGDGYSFTESSYSNTVGGTLYNSASNFSSGDATYDAARANMGGSWRIPTEAECLELFNNTTRSKETINGVPCVKFSKDGKSISIPYLRRIDDTTLKTSSMFYLIFVTSEVMTYNNKVYMKCLSLKEDLSKSENVPSGYWGYSLRPIR